MSNKGATAEGAHVRAKMVDYSVHDLRRNLWRGWSFAEARDEARELVHLPGMKRDEVKMKPRDDESVRQCDPSSELPHSFRSQHFLDSFHNYSNVTAIP